MKKVISLVVVIILVSAIFPHTLTGIAANIEKASEAQNGEYPNDNNIEEGILAKYEFEDASFNNNSKVEDSSGNQYNATMVGDGVVTKGVFGNGIDLKGTAYIELPGELLSEIKSKGALTINAYVKKNALQNQFLFSASKGHGVSNSNSLGIIDAFNYRYESGGVKTSTGKRDTLDNDYMALTTVLDFENDTVKLFVDGAVVGEGSEAMDFSGYTVAGIGVSPWSDPHYNGYIDSFTIWGRALGDDEVKYISGKMSVTPIYRDEKNNREYKGDPIALYTNEVFEFMSETSDNIAFYNYSAIYPQKCKGVAVYDEDGAYEYIIECTSDKNEAYKTADYLVLDKCSAKIAKLPLSVPGFNNSKVTWSCDSKSVSISDNGDIVFEESEVVEIVTLQATIEHNGEVCTKDFMITNHAVDSTPEENKRALDTDGLGYYAVDGENLINKDEFDYTCESYTGWTSGDGVMGDNFSFEEGYNDCSAIFARTLGGSTTVGSINPYIPLPEHTGEESFILTFAAYGDKSMSIEWSNIFLYNVKKEKTTPVGGRQSGENYCYTVSVSPEWSINSFAFTPEKEDKYIRVAIGWASNIGIDNISIVRAAKLNIQISERYITNETAYDAEPIILGESLNTEIKQYGEQYVSAIAPEKIILSDEEYMLITDKEERWVDTRYGEEDGIITFNYRYIKAEDEFLHPGLINTEGELTLIAEKIKNGEEPYASAYDEFIKNSLAQTGSSRAVATIIRGGSDSNYALIYKDVHRAYLCAIRWKLSGDTAYGDCARDILNAWSSTLKTVTGNADRYLAAGIYGYEMACASEIIRDYPGFEKERMQDMLINVFYEPLNERFLYSNDKFGEDHNGAHIMNYWANWDLCNMAAASAIGVFCDRRDIYERVLEYYKFGAGNGSLFNAIPKLYEASEDTMNSPVGQWQEAGRDIPHSTLGVGLMAVICEIAWNQGDDIYSWGNNRFLYGAEYIAQHLYGQKVPYTSYYWYSGPVGVWSQQNNISTASGTRPIFEMIYNHYNKRMGIQAPGIEALLENVRPEGGASESGHASGFDQFGYGTLLYTREAKNYEKAIPHESNVREGIYVIRRSGTDSVLDIDNDGYVVQNTRDEKKRSQQWKLEDLGGGIYTLTNMQSGKTMCIENDSYDLGALVTTGNYEGKFSQQFAFLTLEDGYNSYYNGNYRIVPVGSGLCLDVRNGSLDDETDVLQYTYNSRSFQQWSLERMGTYIEAEKNEGKIDVEIKGRISDGDVVCVLYSDSNEVIEVIKREAKDKLSVQFDKKGKYTRVFLWDKDLKPLCESIEVK